MAQRRQTPAYVTCWGRAYEADALVMLRQLPAESVHLVLTSPPFNLRPKIVKQLCRVNSVDTGVLVTTLLGF